MTIKTNENRTLAFAGIVQALQLVQQIAYGRPYDVDAYQATLQSILLLNSDSVTEIYGSVEGVRSGLRLLQTQLMGNKQKPDAELSRYLVVLLHLERKLSKRADLLERLGKGVEHAQNQVAHFDLMHANVLAGLANTYAETASTLNPKIMINGDPSRLQDATVANQVRALLLAAMRSAVLWRQCGGTRIGLLFGRNKLTACATELLSKGNILH
ncbi:High frequency lysogenization protein HflD [hydrothermal vent metagenome]|uniref:High frequency lysogenization protein HflD n=1 Tax=hydrothermal vent metagenome TaxID=652676 RepID=A0A3B0YAS1_9ZZZZ